MRVLTKLGWVTVAVLALASMPATTHAKRAKAAAADEVAASDADLENRVQAIEKKLDMQTTTTATDSKTMKDRVDAIEKDVKDVQQTISDKLGFEMHGFVAGSYLYNFNDPKSQGNTLRVFDNDANTFTLDQANINILRKKDEGIGFSLNLDFGKAAEIVGGATRWSNSSSNTESHNSIEAREAYLTYKVPVGDGVTLKAGKFVTLLGAEVISNFDNQNFNVSRSISFGFGIPFTHTGLLASFPVGSMVNIDAGIVNGWDNVVDNNSGKTFLGGLNLAPVDMFSMYLSGTYGPEQNSRGNSNRGVLTDVFTIKPADMVTLVAEITYGHETDIVGPSNQAGADWYGGCAYVILKATDALSFALRGEVFDDTDGTRIAGSLPSTDNGQPAGFLQTVGGTGLITTPSGSTFFNGTSNTTWEITPTVAYKITDGLLWRAEYRHDESSRTMFENNDGNFSRKGQDTIGTQLVYAF